MPYKAVQNGLIVYGCSFNEVISECLDQIESSKYRIYIKRNTLKVKEIKPINNITVTDNRITSSSLYERLTDDQRNEIKVLLANNKKYNVSNNL